MKTRSNAVVAAVANVWVLLLAAGVLGLGAWWFMGRSGKTQPVAPVELSPGASGEIQLAAASQAVLAGLSQPVQVRYYQLVRSRPGREAQLAFAPRVAALLRAFEVAAGGKLQVVRRTNPDAESERTAAVTDGLEPLSGGSGEREFLGLVVGLEGNKVVLPRLDPHWEAALEFDLARAIARVAGTQAVPLAAVNPVTVDATEVAALVAAVPEFETLSRAEARQKVQALALEEFRRRVTAWSPGADGANVVAPQLQPDQAAELAEITRHLQRQLELVERLKP